MGDKTKIEWTNASAQSGRSSHIARQAKPAKHHLDEHGVWRNVAPIHPRPNIVILLGAIADIARGHNISGLCQPAFGHSYNMIPCCSPLTTICAATVECFEKVFFSLKRQRGNLSPSKRASRTATQSKTCICGVTLSIKFVYVLATQTICHGGPVKAQPAPLKSIVFLGNSFSPRRARTIREFAGFAYIRPAVTPRGIYTKVDKGLDYATARAGFLAIRSSLYPLSVIAASVLSFVRHHLFYHIPKGRASDELWACKQMVGDVT